MSSSFWFSRSSLQTRGGRMWCFKSLWLRNEGHASSRQLGPIKFPPGDPDPDGSAFLLSDLDGRPETYRAWARDYYEREVSLTAAKHVYLQQPLTAEIVAQLNPDLSLTDLVADRDELVILGNGVVTSFLPAIFRRSWQLFVRRSCRQGGRFAPSTWFLDRPKTPPPFPTSRRPG